jgi:hypothetical protein
MSWNDYPNLRLRPHAPNAGRGRIQVIVRRAFLVGGPVLSSSQIYDWCFTKRRKLTTLKGYMAWRVLRQIADPVGRATTIGRPTLWRLRNSGEKPDTDTE